LGDEIRRRRPLLFPFICEKTTYLEPGTISTHDAKLLYIHLVVQALLNDSHMLKNLGEVVVMISSSWSSSVLTKLYSINPDEKSVYNVHLNRQTKPVYPKVESYVIACNPFAKADSEE
jgi:hypothetical protein